jgi:hypothetical protein
MAIFYSYVSLPEGTISTPFLGRKPWVKHENGGRLHQKKVSEITMENHGPMIRNAINPRSCSYLPRVVSNTLKNAGLVLDLVMKRWPNKLGLE